VNWVGVGLAAAVLAAVAPPRGASAGVVIVGQSASVDRERGSASFDLHFDARPDFQTVDEHGRVADSFQYEIDANGPASKELPVNFIDAVVRGDEIRVANALRVRGGWGDTPDPDPVAGGWGPVRTTVPFNLDGGHLSFEVPLSALGDGAADGIFSYRVFTTDFGLTSSEVESSVGAVSVPLPSGAWAALLAVGGYALVRLRRRPMRY
jgi:hypothetical protein